MKIFPWRKKFKIIQDLNKSQRELLFYHPKSKYYFSRSHIILLLNSYNHSISFSPISCLSLYNHFNSCTFQNYFFHKLPKHKTIFPLTYLYLSHHLLLNSILTQLVSKEAKRVAIPNGQKSLFG